MAMVMMMMAVVVMAMMAVTVMAAVVTTVMAAMMASVAALCVRQRRVEQSEPERRGRGNGQKS
jgi:MFS superfamily sulfate permease-like transporter